LERVLRGSSGSSPAPAIMNVLDEDRFLAWQENVRRWKKEYKHVAKKFREPINLALTSAFRACKKCNSEKDVHRHHKGHEYLFACLMPERYAARYIRFLASDTVRLCAKCHEKVHITYQSVIDDLVVYLDGADKVSYKKLEIFRKRMVKLCNDFLNA
jgi:hypothetical protein